MQSKIKIGDKVIYNDGMTKPFSSIIIEIKFAAGKWLYKLKDRNVFFTQTYLSHDNNNN
jgi:hypothetical protein